MVYRECITAVYIATLNWPVPSIVGSPSHARYGKWLHTRNANHDMSLKWLKVSVFKWKSCCVWAVLLVQCLHEEISTTVHSAICDVTYVTIRHIAETHLIIHVHAANAFNLSCLRFWSLTHGHTCISVRLSKIYSKWSVQTNKPMNKKAYTFVCTMQSC